MLLDGLDEVYETDNDRVLQDIKTFAHQFRTCQCVITCRIAAREYTFEQFTEVEVADFNKKQIAEFATQWFKGKKNPQKAKVFIQNLKANEPISELAITPILLTLLCLVFEEKSEFPSNRADLYREGTDLLLKKWDAQRDVKRDLIYKKLSSPCKKELLSQIAFETFGRGAYFFKQATVEQHIIRYIRNLPEASDDEKALQLDEEAVLKSIEAQHGLLVERARGIYSFSHLTFQEYFTAHHITSPTANLHLALQNLATRITEKRYREVVFLTVGMLPEADRLLLLMKWHIDHLMVDDLAADPKLQAVLVWIQQKAASVQASYQPAAIRAFYYALVRDLARYNIVASNIHLARDIDLNLVADRALDRDRAHTRDFARDIDLTHDIDLARDIDLNLVLDRALDLARDINLDYALDNYRDFDLNFALNRAQQTACQDDPKLKLKIHTLGAKLPDRSNSKTFKQWWEKNGKIWVENLRAVMIEHRNIGHDWQFTKAQKERLRQYYGANKLLVTCLNSDCYVTKATRQYIEDTLLLPLSEIEKYPVPDAIANL